MACWFTTNPWRNGCWLTRLMRHDVEHIAVGFVHSSASYGRKVSYGAIHIIVDDALYRGYVLVLNGQHGA